MIGIDYLDRMPGGALELVADTGVTYPQLADPTGEVRVPFRVARGLPGVVLVDRDGEVRHIEYVAIRSYQQLRELVREHLGVEV